MNGVVQYILTVTAAAILAAVLQSLAGQGTMGAMVKLITGVFMALTVLSPLVKVEVPDLEQWFSSFAAEGASAAAAGEDMANDAAWAIIKAQVEAYILDKAAGYDASLSVEAVLDETGVPVSVTLSGAISPYARARLMRMLEDDLGLGEEAQQWIS